MSPAAIRCRGERLENRAKAIDSLAVAADHHAVAFFEPPNAPASADIDKMDLFVFQLLAPPHRFFVIAVAAVDNEIARVETLR